MKIKLYLSPKITSMSHSLSVFCFSVDRSATKNQISLFVETHYATEVLKVNTLIRDGKEKKKGRFLYKRQSKKIAYVTIKSGANTMNLMQEMAQSFMRKHGLNNTTNRSLDEDFSTSGSVLDEALIDEKDKEVTING